MGVRSVMSRDPLKIPIRVEWHEAGILGRRGRAFGSSHGETWERLRVSQCGLGGRRVGHVELSMWKMDLIVRVESPMGVWGDETAMRLN